MSAASSSVRKGEQSTRTSGRSMLRPRWWFGIVQQVMCRVREDRMNDDELRVWAERIVPSQPGCHPNVPVAFGIFRLLDENAALRAQVAGHCERIAAQSELLSRRAEVSDLVVSALASVPLGMPIPAIDPNKPSSFKNYGAEVFDGSTGTTNPVAGRKVGGSGV